MKKIILITLSVGIIIAMGAYGVFNYLSKETVSIKQGDKPDGGTIIEVQEERKEPIEEEFPLAMKEFQIKNAIHGMSHQKIEAEDKWGFVPMTAERIARLIMVVENNKYDNETLFLSILNRWKNNDFSQVDSDHNAIWRLQNGNVGKASGILTVEEEQKFIEKHFKVEK